MTKRLHKRDLDLTLIAKIGLWLDDPYGDGIRLLHIREPNEARRAAIDFVQTGQLGFFDEKAIRAQYEERVLGVFNKDGHIAAYVHRNLFEADYD